jgi:hypothetical protein
MLRVVLAASLLVGCRISLDSEPGVTDGPPGGRACKVSTTSAPCMDAATHSDLTWIQANILDASCIFSGCHNGASTAAGKTDLRMGMSYGKLVNVPSPHLDTQRLLVKPGDPQNSWLMVMLGDEDPTKMTPPGTPPPASVGLMPQNSGGALLCCQKMDALDRWITAGAMNN